MTIINNEHEIKKIAIGDKIIMENKTSKWTSLECNFVTSGDALFYDNGDGTAYLTGAIVISGDTTQPVIKAPKGYSFESWVNPPWIQYSNSVGLGDLPIINGDIYLKGSTRGKLILVTGDPGSSPFDVSHPFAVIKINRI